MPDNPDRMNIIKPTDVQSEQLKKMMGGSPGTAAEMIYGPFVEKPAEENAPAQESEQNPLAPEAGNNELENPKINRKFTVHGELVEKKLTDDEVHGLAQKALASDKTITQKDLEIQTLTENYNQLLLENEALSGEAQVGRNIKDLQTNYPDLYNQADSLIQQGLANKGQPVNVDSPNEDIVEIEDLLKDDRYKDVDIEPLKKMLNVLKKSGQQPANDPVLQQLRNELAQVKQQQIEANSYIQTTKKDSLKQKSDEIMNRLINVAGTYGIEITDEFKQTPQAKDMLALMTGGRQIEDAFRIACQLPDKPNTQNQEGQTVSEQKPVSMQKRAPVNGNNGLPQMEIKRLNKSDMDKGKQIYGFKFGQRMPT